MANPAYADEKARELIVTAFHDSKSTRMSTFEELRALWPQDDIVTALCDIGLSSWKADAINDSVHIRTECLRLLGVYFGLDYLASLR